MARPWEELIPESARGDYAEVVDSEVGTHVRTRPGPGYTPEGGGRPTGPIRDDPPIPYRQGPHDTEFGIRDTEELAAPPLPERPKDGLPKQPAEFEATWQDRYLERTKGKGQATKPLILPASVSDDSEIGSMLAELDKMQAAVKAKIRAKEEAAASKTDTTLIIQVDLSKGNPTATLGSNALDPRAAISLVQALLK